MKSNVNFLKYIKRIFWKIGERAFSAILIFILFDVILGILIIYIYVILPQGKNINPSEESLKFREDVYEKVIENINK